MSQYSRGAYFERQVKKALEADGCFVVRAAGSKGPVDLVVVVKYESSLTPFVVLVQCKTSGRISKAELGKLLKLKRLTGATVAVASRPKGKRSGVSFRTVEPALPGCRVTLLDRQARVDGWGS